MANTAEILAVLTAAALVGRETISDEHLAAMAAELAQHGLDAGEVSGAARRVIMRGERLTARAILRALPDGWPAAEEAWRAAQRGERMPVLAARAYALAQRVSQQSEGMYRVFATAYERAVADALARGEVHVVWTERISRPRELTYTQVASATTRPSDEEMTQVRELLAAFARRPREDGH